jgi:ABC-2 type transport system permease protein
VNFRQLLAIVRMRWRITYNQLAKQGKLNAGIAIFIACAAILSTSLVFLVSITFGAFLMRELTPSTHMYIWDGLVCAFIVMWMFGLLTDLQRSDALSLNNLLHLPVSLSGAFLLNYLTSLVSFTFILLLPAMLGVGVALVILHGLKMMSVFPLIVAFLLMVSSVTYQFKGWLGRMMENKRRRGTVMAIVTIGFVMIFQLPQMFNMTNVGRWTGINAELNQQMFEEVGDIDPSGLTSEEIVARQNEIIAKFAELQTAESAADSAKLDGIVTGLNTYLPLGWLPYGIRSAMTGNLAATGLCVIGMLAIAAASLRMSYTSTIRAYRGSAGRIRKKTASTTKTTSPTQDLFVAKSVPFLSDRQSAIAVTTLRSMIRAPETKLALMTPLIFMAVFGSMAFSGAITQIPAEAKSFLGIGLIGTCMFGAAQLLLNIFGTERQGFKAYVLSPVERRDILLGKNMAVLPVILSLSLLLVVIVQILLKVQLTHLLATCLQLVPIMLMFMLIGNIVSIMAPVAMAVGSAKPVAPKFMNILIQMVGMFVSPVLLLPAMVSCGAEVASNYFFEFQIPIYLVTSLIQLPIGIWIYRKAIDFQGNMLQFREQKILEIVSAIKE